jgi:hypothetical protein
VKSEAVKGNTANSIPRICGTRQAEKLIVACNEMTALRYSRILEYRRNFGKHTLFNSGKTEVAKNKGTTPCEMPNRMHGDAEWLM